MKLRFLADECCDASLVEALRADGLDVVFVAETYPGQPDDKVLAHAFEQGRILITEDKDFGELTIRFRKPVVGVVLLRLDPADREQKIVRMRLLIAKYGNKLKGFYSVVGRNRIRFRPLHV